MNLCLLPTDPGSSKVGFAINKSLQIASLMFHHSENSTSSSPQISTWLWWCTSLLHRQNWKTKKHHFTSIYQGLGFQIQQKSTQNMWLPSMVPTYPAWGKGTSSTQKCRLLGDMLVPKRVIQLPSSIRSFISGWIMIFQWHQPQPCSEIWLTIRQQFCFPHLFR